jgi:hypothetical protein
MIYYWVGRVLSAILMLICFPLRGIATGLWLFHQWVERGAPFRSLQDYPDLSPTSDPEHVSACSTALEAYLARPGVMNIAITAPYAGGKTSFINHFFKYRPYRVQTVSLATFIDRKKAKGLPEEHALDQFLNIEQSILQQLVQSSYRSMFIKYVWSLLIITSAITAYHVYTAKVSLVEVARLIDTEDWRGIAVLVLAVSLLSFAIVVIKDIATLYQTYRMKRVNLAFAEIEIDHGAPSLLNNNLSQLRDHFARNPRDVVVFEDLDRFHREDIFLKLREINKLLNDSLPTFRSSVKFIYAVADDVFEYRLNRTKFFDAIVSLVPVTNSHKSLALLRRAVCSTFSDEVKCKLEPVIQDVSVYINDMRLLNNIVADYKITSETLRLSHGDIPDPVGLFAFTVYKNYYPGDFSELHDGKGWLYVALSRKFLSDFRVKLTEDITNGLADLRDKIERVESERLRSIEALNKTYFADFLVGMIKTHGAIVEIGGVELEDYYRKLAKMDYRDNSAVRVRLSSGYRASDQIVRPEELPNYSRSYENITSRPSLSRWRIQYHKQQAQKLDINKRTMAQLLDAFPERGREFLQRGGEEFPELLFVLLRYGHLDERYSIYTTHSHDDDELSGNDVVLLRCIMSAAPPMPTLKLSNLPKLIERIHGNDWESSSIINYDLASHLLAEPDRFDRLKSILRVIGKSSSKCSHFASIWRQGTDTKKLVETAIDVWEDIYTAIARSEDIDDREKCDILLGLLLVSRDYLGDDFDGANVDAVARYLSQVNYLFGSAEAPPGKTLDEYIDVLKLVGVEFEDLTLCVHDRAYFETVFANDLYEFNEVNLRKIAEFAYDDKLPQFKDDLSWFALTQFDSIHDRMLSNIGATVRLVSEEGFTVSDPDEIYSILESSAISEVQISAFIKCLKNRVRLKSHSKALEDILVPLVEEDKVVVDWDVMLSLSESSSVDTFVEFSDKNAEELAAKAASEEPEVHIEYRKILPIDKLSINAFKTYFSALDLREPNVDSLTDDQVRALIGLDKLDASKACMESVCEGTPSLLVAYIEQYNERLLDGEFEVNVIDDASVSQLLDSDSVVPVIPPF